MPRNPAQAFGFLLGFWLALWLWPGSVEIARAQAEPFGELEASLWQAVNAARARHHRIPLERRPDLDRVARAHSEDMARRQYLAHESPEGVDPLDRIQSGASSGFTLAAENVGTTNRPDPNSEILRSWLASPVHRGNLLAPSFNATGVGISRAADGSLLYTQVYVTYPR
ncbi:MAG: CAP domain-containing protein [Myxococcales bacterium]|nr:CAP domain-containing protein [Myxococcales bacterium]